MEEIMSADVAKEIVRSGYPVDVFRKEAKFLWHDAFLEASITACFNTYV